MRSFDGSFLEFSHIFIACLLTPITSANAFDFEPYRNIDESMEFKGSGGYRDCWGIVFRGISDSYLPMLKINMVMYHDEKHISPSEKLYKYCSNSGKSSSFILTP